MLCRVRRVRRRAARSWLSQVQRNELSLFGATENRTRKIAPQQHARAAEGNSRRQRYCAHDDAEKNDIDQQVGNIVFLVEIRILIPRHAGVVVHRA